MYYQQRNKKREEIQTGERILPTTPLDQLVSQREAGPLPNLSRCSPPGLHTLYLFIYLSIYLFIYFWPQLRLVEIPGASAQTDTTAASEPLQ